MYFAIVQHSLRPPLKNELHCPVERLQLFLKEHRTSLGVKRILFLCLSLDAQASRQDSLSGEEFAPTALPTLPLLLPLVNNILRAKHHWTDQRPRSDEGNGRRETNRPGKCCGQGPPKTSLSGTFQNHLLTVL